MKTKLQIEFDFEQARRRAAELEEIAENISQLSRPDIENAKADLSSAWKGESAQHFQKKTEILQEDIRGRAKELNAIAAAIREIAAKIYAAEMEALRIATQREYI